MTNAVNKQAILDLREEIQHHQAEIQRHQAAIPLIASLLIERGSLRQHIDSLEIENRSVKEAFSLFEEEMLALNTFEEKDEPFFSIKNCYIEASLSLGSCSNDLLEYASKYYRSAE